MSVYLLSAVRRERRVLAQLAEAVGVRGGPDSVASLIRSAQQDLEEADLHLVRLLDAAVREGTK